ncbi:MAG: hypothetical protein NVSMB52_03650 [Chloroflexota bacterium]
MTVNGSSARSYIYMEAFCLMRYETDDGTESEWVWNSRDGTTPFVIMNRAHTRELTHVDWHLDTRLPEEFEPPKGMRYFTNITEESARASAEMTVERYWGDPRVPRPSNWESKDMAVDELVAIMLSNPEAPMLVEELGHANQRDVRRSR